MRATMMDHPLTLQHFLERAGELFGEVEIASRQPDRSLHRYFYADFHRRSRRLGAALQALGLRRGDRVGTLMWNHHRHLECYFGITAVGGVLHTLNLRLNPSDIAYIVNHAADRFLIVDDVLWPLLESFRDQIHPEQIIVATHGEPGPPGALDYEELLEDADSEGWQYPRLEEDDAAGMCYTSGTTGRPKGVVYSHRSLVLHSIVECMPDILGLSQDDSVLPVVPMFHANAWGLPFSATLAGCRQVFPGPHLDPVSLLELMRDEKITFAGGVPTIWMGILEQLKSDPKRWTLASGMRMVVGGSAVPEQMIREFDRFELKILHAWGMTEMTPLGSLCRLKPHQRELPADERYAVRAKQGLPAPLVELRTVSPEGVTPRDGETMGELQARGPWVASEYYRPEDPAGNWTDDGWFRTGDVATRDAEGFIKITDRTKDLIKSGGEWISSVDLENALMAHPDVAEAAVIAVPDPKWQERPLAAVVLRPEADANADQLTAFLADRFAKWWLPDRFEFLDSLPRTSTGKFKKSELRERFG